MIPIGSSERPLSSTTTTLSPFAVGWAPLLALGRTRSSSCSFQTFWHMTESDPFHVFDGSAQNVISITSYIETVGSYSTRPLSKGLYRPSDDDGVLTCVDSLFICGLCWNPPQNQQFWQIPSTKHWMLIHSGTITSQLPILAHTGLNMKPWEQY